MSDHVSSVIFLNETYISDFLVFGSLVLGSFVFRRFVLRSLVFRRFVLRSLVFGSFVLGSVVRGSSDGDESDEDDELKIKLN